MLRRDNAYERSFYVLPIAVVVTVWVNVYFILTKVIPRMRQLATKGCGLAVVCMRACAVAHSLGFGGWCWVGWGPWFFRESAPSWEGRVYGSRRGLGLVCIECKGACM